MMLDSTKEVIIMNEDKMKYIISRLIDNANEALAESPEDDFIKGKRLAYYEMLDTITNELELSEYDLKEFGLDIDITKFI